MNITREVNNMAELIENNVESKTPFAERLADAMMGVVMAVKQIQTKDEVGDIIGLPSL